MYLFIYLFWKNVCITPGTWGKNEVSVCRSSHIAQALLFQPSSGNTGHVKKGFCWYKPCLRGAAWAAFSVQLAATSHFPPPKRCQKTSERGPGFLPLWVACSRSPLQACIAVTACVLWIHVSTPTCGCAGRCVPASCPCHCLHDLGLSKVPGDASHNSLLAAAHSVKDFWCLIF